MININIILNHYSTVVSWAPTVCWAILGTVLWPQWTQALLTCPGGFGSVVGVGVTKQTWRYCCSPEEALGQAWEVIRWRIGDSPVRWREVSVDLSSGTTGSHGRFQSMSSLMGQLWPATCFCCALFALFVPFWFVVLLRMFLHMSMVRKKTESIFCDMWQLHEIHISESINELLLALRRAQSFPGSFHTPIEELCGCPRDSV